MLRIIQNLRAEIPHLQKVLDLLEDVSSSASERRGPGRPRGTAGGVASVVSGSLAPQKRGMSAEGKARISAAKKKRWAKAKRATASNPQKGESLAPKTGARSRFSKTPTKSRPARKTAATSKKAERPASKKTSGWAVKRPAKAATDQTPATE